MKMENRLLKSKFVQFVINMFIPLIAFALIINIVIILAAIFFWTFPHTFYIPFVTGVPSQPYVDRFFLIIGIFVALFSKYED